MRGLIAIAGALGGCAATEHPCAWDGDCGPAARVEDEDDTRPEAGRAEAVDPSECGDDGECPADRPWCVAAGCRACAEVGGDAFCRQMGQAVCTPWGRCGACDPASIGGCTDEAPYCADDFACGGCTRQLDCGDAGCERASGVCLEDYEVVWVDPHACGGMAIDGVTVPRCSLAQALAEIGQEGSATIRLAAADLPYRAPIVRTGGSLVIDAEPGVVLAPDGDGVRVGEGARLTLAGATIAAGPSATAIHLEGGQAWIEDVVIVGGMRGVVARGGTVDLQRVRIEGTAREAIVADAGAEVSLVDTVVVHAAREPGAVAIDVVGARIGMRYCTVVDNGSASRTTLRCDADGSAVVRASIVAGADSPAFACPDLHDEGSVLDHDGPLGRGSRAEPLWPPGFADLVAGDVHLSPAGATRWAGLARWQRGDPLSDADGDPRTGVDLAFEHPGVDRP